MKSSELLIALVCVVVSVALWYFNTPPEPPPLGMQVTPAMHSLRGQYGLSIYSSNGKLIEVATRSSSSSSSSSSHPVASEKDTPLEFQTFEDAVRYAIKLQEYLGPQCYVHVTQEL